MNLPKKKRKKRKPRKGFSRSAKAWEESIASHIGHVIDNSSLKDISEAALMAGLSYFGYKEFGVPGAVLGPVSLKLAMTPGGVGIPVSQTAGVIGLVSMGLAMQKEPEVVPPDEQGGCPEGYKLSHNLFYGWHCVKMGMPPS